MVAWSSRRRRLALAPIVLALVAAACGGSPTPSGEPAGTQPAATSTATQAPGSPATNPGASPLPAPTLTDPVAIGEALWDSARVAQGVASLVEALGIDIYASEGQLVRDAAAPGPAGMWLFEAEVRGLIEMGEVDAAAIAAHEAAPTLGDLSAGFAAVWPGLTFDAVLDAYVQAYRAAPGDLVRESFAGHAFVKEGAFTRVHLWLFVLDGVLDRPQPATATTVAFTAGGVVAGPVANVQLPAPDPALAGLMAIDLTALPVAIAHMASLAYTLPLDFTVSPPTVHEGHGGAGQPAILKVKSGFVPTPINSPLTGLPILIPNRVGLDGLPVTFQSPHEATLSAHGDFSGGQGAPGTLPGSLGIPVLTDVLGEFSFTYTPRSEPADGRGDVETDVAVITASVNVRDILLYMYPAGGAANLGVGIRFMPAVLVLEWHEEHESPNPGVPGTYTANLIGPAPGAGSHAGSGTLLCTRTAPTGSPVWSVSSGPLQGGLSGILMMQSADGRDSVYVTPTGLGIEAQWGASAPSAATQVLDITGQLGNPSVVTARVEYTFGVNPPIPYTLIVTVTCSDTITD